MVSEEVVRKVPVTTTRYVQEEQVDEIPVRVCRQEQVEETVRVPVRVEKRVPVVYTYRVPRTVVYRVPIDPCGNVVSVAPPIVPGSAMPESPTATYPSRKKKEEPTLAPERKPGGDEDDANKQPELPADGRPLPNATNDESSARAPSGSKSMNARKVIRSHYERDT
jgi:hypothetical protein